MNKISTSQKNAVYIFLCWFALTTWILCLSGINAKLHAQQNVWKDVGPGTTLPAQKENLPHSYRLLELDSKLLKDLLKNAPLEFSTGKEVLLIEFPMPDGKNIIFSIIESPIMEAPEKFPYIKTYIASSFQASMRFDFTTEGFHAMIHSGSFGTVFIDPLNKEGSLYICYYKKDLPVPSFTSPCLRNDEIKEHDYKLNKRKIKAGEDNNPNAERSSGTQLRTYRLALTADTSYCNYFGNSDSAIMSNIAIAINRVNQIYESEADIRFILIANNDQLLLDPPLGLGAPSSPNLTRNQVITDSIIGNGNYDIGHYFTIGTGGLASVGATCRPNVKARGGTGRPVPVGDAFYVDYVCHEIGHQMGANHTYNQISGGCSLGQWVATSAFEPGSGSTIMSYAGICGAADLQSNSDPHFHTGSFDEIYTYTQTDSGNTCAAISASGNTPPSVTVGIDYSIPTMTPFMLSGTGSDANGDPLTYCWEEIDTGPNGAWNLPGGNAPVFRSFTPTTDSIRIFPRIEALVRDTTYRGEIFPGYARVLNFRLTVRDNRAAGGGITYNDSPKLVSLVTGGPFSVTVPNTSINWKTESIDTVKWDPGISTAPPVSCSLVDIYLSVDSGYTYPYLLKSHTPNDGIEDVLIPDTITDIARIKVQAVGNIFFDISNINFSIINNPIAVTAVVAPVTCNGLGNGSIDQTISGAFPPVTHHWSNGAVTEDISSLPPGFYTDTIHDGFDEIHIATYYITEPTVLSATCSAINATCAYSADGNSSVIAIGGTSPYSYLWSNGDTTAIADALAAGSYTVVITDANGCTGSCGTTIGSPSPIIASVTGINPILCNGGHGCVTISASGGIPPYTNTGSLCGLFAGHHDITVTDSMGCSSLPVSVDLTEPSMLTLVLTQLSPILCHGNTTCVSITPTGGTPPYVPYPFPVTICGVPAGVHFYNIVDANYCIGVSSITITEPTELTVTCGGQDVVCHGDSNGVAFVLASGGTPGYTYAWSNGSAGPGISSLAPGIYSVTVSDVFGCNRSCSYEVEEPDVLALTCTGSDLLCSDDHDGTAGVLVGGGNPPYVYSWQNGSTSFFISGLSKGNHMVVVTDNNNCIDSCIAVVSAPDTLIANCIVTADVTCPGDSNGEIMVTATGGTAPYTGIGTFSNLLPGAYSYTVTDANACQSTCTPVVTTLFSNSGSPTSVSSDAPANTTCTGSPVTLTVHGGSLGSGASWRWYKYGCGTGTSIGTGNTVTVIPATAGAHAYFVRAEGICDTTACASILIEAVSSIVPFSITGIDSLCTSTGFSTAYNVFPATATTSYLWTVPAGTSISGGQGTSALSVNYSSTAIANGINGLLCVQATGACYDTLLQCTAISINAVKPVTPPSISGPTKLCPGDTATYSIAPVFRASGYIWLLPSGMSFVSTENQNIITTVTGPGYLGGTLSVMAVNSCGASSARSKTLLFNLPLQPKPISGPTYGICSISGAVFSTSGATSATSYSWLVPSGISLTSGAGSASISIDASSTFSSGVISVTGVNNCGSGPVRSLNISGAPAKAVSVSGDITICPGQSGEIYTASTIPSTITYEWIVPGGVAIVSGQGTKILTVDYGTASASGQVISVRGINSCGTGVWRNLAGISIDSVNCGVRMNHQLSQFSTSNISLVPNPAKDHFQVIYSSKYTEKGILQLRDVSGRLIYTAPLEIYTGDNIIEVKIPKPETGIYLVGLYLQEAILFSKLILE